MWGAIIGGIKELGSLWLKTKKAKAESQIAYNQQLAKTEADWDTYALQQAQYSWKDELIMMIWYAPLVVAWFEPERADKWVAWVADLPLFYQVGMFGIMAASFGLRWYFKQQNFKLPAKIKEQANANT